MDLGCGAGQQLCNLSRKLSEDGLAVGLDISADSLRRLLYLSEKSRASNLQAVLSDFNSLNCFQEGSFDIIMSNFSIYYAANPIRVINQVVKKLRPNGRCFVCGPGVGNNRELLKFCKTFMLIPKINTIQQVKRIGRQMQRIFSKFETTQFTNTLTFSHSEQLTTYWRSYYVYNPAFEEAFLEAVKVHFERERVFVTTKEVVGFVGKK